MEKQINKVKIAIIIASIALSIALIGAIVLFALFKTDDKDNNLTNLTLKYVVGDIENGNYFVDQKVTDNKVDEPSQLPVKNNMFFEGWYLDEQCSQKATFPIISSEDVTLYANYLPGNLPSANIGYDDTLHEYYVKGVLGTVASDTLIIPDSYNDGVHPTRKLTYIENVQSNLSLLTNNSTITKLYIGNNISIITDYFAYNSTKITSVVFGKKVSQISASAFKSCIAMQEVETTSPEGWLDMSVNNLVNCIGTVLKKNFFLVSYVTDNKLLLDQSESGQAINYENSEFNDREVPATTNNLLLREEDIPKMFPYTLNYRFAGWSDNPSRDSIVDLNTYELTKDTTFYAVYQASTCTSDMILFDDTTNGIIGEKYKGAYYITNTKRANTTFANTILVIPDVYNDGINGICPVIATQNGGFLSEDTLVVEVYFGNFMQYVGSYFADTSTTLKKVEFPQYTLLEDVSFDGGYTITKQEFIMDNIGVFAFNRTPVATKLKLNVKTIGEYAFSNCLMTGLDLTGYFVGRNVFASCTSMIKATLQKVTDLSRSYAFYNCTSLEEVSIPKELEMLGRYSFSGTPNLKKLYWNASKLTQFGEDDFDSSNNVFNGSGTNVGGMDLIVGNDVEEIPPCFMAPTNQTVGAATSKAHVKSVTFEEGSVLTTIMSYAFEGLKELTSIEIPDSVEYIDNYAFSCAGLQSVVLGDNVKHLGWGSFYNCISLTSVNLPDSLETIEGVAFDGSDLVSITIPENVKCIGRVAFGHCKLTEINWNVIELDDTNEDQYYKDTDGLNYTIFYDPSNTAKVVNIGSKAKTIPKLLFGNNSSNTTYKKYPIKMTEINFAENCELETIGERAFYKVDDLTEITIPASVQSIGEYAFYEASDLTTLEVAEGSSLQTISKDAFHLNRKLANVTLNEGLVTIGESAFAATTLLKTVNIPSTVVTISQRAFWVSGLTSVNFATNCVLQEIGQGAFLDTPLQSVTIPKSLVTLGVEAFKDSRLEELLFEDGISLQTISEGAFSFCTTLTSVIIPDSVISIEVDAFDSCTSLTSVVIKHDTQVWWWSSTGTETSTWTVLSNYEPSTVANYLRNGRAVKVEG